MPRDAPLVVALATDPNRGQGRQVSTLLSRFLGADVAVSMADGRIKDALGLPRSDRLGPLLGNDLVVARTTRGVLLAWVVNDAAQLRRIAAHVRGYATQVRGSLLLAGAPAAVRQALTQRSGMTPQLFAARLHGLPSDVGLTVGIRDLRHVIRYALARLKVTDRGAYRRYEIARRALKLIRRGDIDGDVIDQLTGTATVWSPDLRTFTITAPVQDPARMAKALGGLRPLIDRILGALGLAGARYGVSAGTFVATTDPAGSLARLAAGGRPQRPADRRGALAGVIRGQALGQALIDRLGLPPIASLSLSTLGDTVFAVRTTTRGVEASADMTIRR